MHRLLILFMSITLLTGCAKLAHLQELLTMKAYGDNQDLQHKYVEEQSEKFEKLLEVVKENRVEEFSNKKAFLKNFGEPILSKMVEEDGQKLERWLYRYATEYSGSPKVYVYFDGSDKLLSWRHEAPHQKEAGK